MGGVEHIKRDRDKLLVRVRKIRGQLNAVEAAITEEDDCSRVLNTLAACRGALNGLMLEILEGTCGATWWIRTRGARDQAGAGDGGADRADPGVHAMRGRRWT